MQVSLRKSGFGAGNARIRTHVRQLSVVVRASKDQIVRGISENGQVSILVANSTGLVTEAATRHRTAPTATAALGRALTGALLMGVFRKEGESLQINFNGRGMLGQMTVIADWQGNVKGMVQNPLADPPLKANGKLDVASAVGKGVLSVIRSLPWMKEPYTGVVPIHSGEVAEDLAYYLADSEQTQSALGLGVSLNKDGSVRHAGGFLISVLPFAEEETLEQLEKNLSSAPSVTDMMNAGLTPEGIAERLMEGLGVSGGVDEKVPCYGPCESGALKQRMKKAVSTLGMAEVKKIIEEEGKIEVNCEFCQETVVFSEADISDVFALAAERTSS